MEPRHRDAVTYAEEQVAVTVADLVGWDVKQLVDGRYAVSGPCPSCNGPSFGPSLDLADAGDERTVAPDQRYVPASCTCGRDHGATGKTSCGRRWFVPVVP